MNKFELELVFKNGTSKRFSKCIYTVWERDIYTPYSKIYGTFLCENINFSQLSDTVSLCLYVNSILYHKGIPDKLDFNFGASSNLLNFSSRGFTLLLGQNQPQPKINSNINLSDLLTKNISSPEITCEENTKTVNYIYVKENSTVWDAVTAYCLKAYGTYPYIKGNKVMATCSNSPVTDFSSPKIVNYSFGLDTTLVLSDIYMSDEEGNYKFHSQNDDTLKMGIQRVKFIPLDRQWLSDTQLGLKGKLDFSKRGMKFKSCTYLGFNGENLMDKISSLHESLNGKRINSLRVTTNKKGTFTTVKCYDDFFGQL